MKKATIALLLICTAAFAQRIQRPQPPAQQPPPAAPATTATGGNECEDVLAWEKGTFTDARDKKTYKTVEICEQIWMAENLSFNAKGSKCYGEKGKIVSGGGMGITTKKTLSPSEVQANCKKYGRLYDWATMMAIAAKYNKELYANTASANTALTQHQGICPKGWHLPSQSEYETLYKAVDASYANYDNKVGKRLKAESGWNSNYPGTDEFGFSALPGGGGASDGTFYDGGEVGLWWAASEKGSDRAYYQVINSISDGSGIGGDDPKPYFHSVRCVKDLNAEEIAQIKKKNEEEAARKAAILAAVERGTFTDDRDKKTYKTVKIDKQTWLAENLNYDEKGSSRCYEDKPENCAKYGRLYDLATAKKSCPSSWHLPSKSEYEALNKAIGVSNEATPKKLKAKSGWKDDGKSSGNGTDDYGFSALPGGVYIYQIPKFGLVGSRGYWWTADAYYLNISHENREIIKWYNDDKQGQGLHSVRCVKD